MAKQEISAVQIQMAAAAGVELLKVEDLRWFWQIRNLLKILREVRKFRL
jgi:hypothetical protein